MARRRRTEFRAYEYTARPRGAKRTVDGVEESYWTVRCRKKGMMGEWSLGWHSSNRSAEYAFFAWVEKHRATPTPVDGTASLVTVIDRYIEMVPTMSKRPRTKENRIFRARKLRAFVEATNASMTVAEFDKATFEQYLGWLRDVRKHSPQTIENALIGARTILRWAEVQGLVSDPPKVPSFRVPAPQHEVLYAEDMAATIEHAEAPLDVMLQLLWVTGMRFAEAATTRGCDLLPDELLVVIQERDLFVPKTPESARRVPVTPELMKQLVELATAPDAPLFPCSVDRVYHYWRHRFYKAQDAAGVRRFTFHDIRRAVADRLRNGGVPLDRYAKVMGHAAVTAVRHYSTVAPGDLHDALEAGLGAARRREPRPNDDGNDDA